MKRRDKPSFKDETSGLERATDNVFKRDMLLAELVKAQVREHRLTIYQVDGARTVEQMATLVERHFDPFLHSA